MKFDDFAIGDTFWTYAGKWRVTDKGSRTVIAMQVDPVRIVRVQMSDGVPGPEQHLVLTEAEAEAEGWFIGPPYKVGEAVFDEYHIEKCTLSGPWAREESE